jgi:hypothetical protein
MAHSIMHAAWVNRQRTAFAVGAAGASGRRPLVRCGLVIRARRRLGGGARRTVRARPVARRRTITPGPARRRTITPRLAWRRTITTGLAWRRTITIARPARRRATAVVRPSGSARCRAIRWPRSRRWIGARWRMRPGRWSRTPRRRRPMHPVVFAAVPRPAPIIAAPVIADAERHDADPQLRAELENGHAPALIVVIQIIAVHPAAVALPVHIAPSPIVETPVHIQESAGRNGHDQGIVGARSGAQVHETLGVGGTGPRGRSETDGCEGEERQGQTFHELPIIAFESLPNQV